MVTRKRGMKRDAGVFGTGGEDPDGKIAAAEKQAWIYVGQIANPTSVSTEDVIKYLKRLGDHEYTCVKLDSRGNYGAFKVGVPYSLREGAMDPNFWPRNVNIRRFNFYGRRNGSGQSSFLDKPTQ